MISATLKAVVDAAMKAGFAVDRFGPVSATTARARLVNGDETVELAVSRQRGTEDETAAAISTELNKAAIVDEEA